MRPSAIWPTFPTARKRRWTSCNRRSPSASPRCSAIMARWSRKRRSGRDPALRDGQAGLLRLSPEKAAGSKRAIVLQEQKGGARLGRTGAGGERKRDGQGKERVRRRRLGGA